MQELDSLVEILEVFLGESKNGSSDNGQVQFNCPECDDEGGHYNLEVNLLRGKYRCWCCEHTNNMYGKLSNLIKKYGGTKLLSEYREQIKDIKKSKEYELNFVDQNLVFEEDEDLMIKLPVNTFDFLFDNNSRESRALEYLKLRGFTKEIIKKYSIKYTDNSCPDKNFRNRIIITSYDKYGELNYYTGRDYTGKSFRKYYNVENSQKYKKTEIIFNEKLLNFDGDITLVEGPVDHIAVPNSEPLLGKVINSNHLLFEHIVNKSSQNIIVFLDNDAMDDAIEVCRRLSRYELCGRLKIVPTQKLLNILNKTKKLNLKKLDPGKLFELYGYRGISWALKMAEPYECI